MDVVCHCLRRTDSPDTNSGRRRSFVPAVRCGSLTGIKWRAISILVFAIASVTGCGEYDPRIPITVWHQSRPAERDFLQQEIERFEAANPHVRVLALYKETEELRASFQSAALAGRGPELVYGPSDVLDTFHTMGLLQDMSNWLPKPQRGDFVDGALTFLPSRKDPSNKELVQIGDRFGNHLALVYNRNFVPQPPATTQELVELAKQNTIDANRDGQKERYGLVWNYTEPFFAIPFVTGYGAWVFTEPAEAVTTGAAPRPVPDLGSPQAANAYRFIKALRDEHGVIPANCDYELADTLFKTGHAAMIINGDWSWADYLNIPEIDAAVAVLPVVNETGLPMKPMIAPKGYSLNRNTTPEIAKEAMAFVAHMTHPDVQHRIVTNLKMLPARKSALDDPLFKTDATLQASLAQLKNGRLMPVETELRAVWDAMRPPYQALLGGAMTPERAANAMQHSALEKIKQIRYTSQPTAAVPILQGLGILLLVGLVIWQRHSFVQFLRDWRRNRLAYLFVLPSIVAIFAVIVFPFFYNVILSLSNKSLGNIEDWQVVGVQNYVEVLRDPNIWRIFAKTILWTLVNIVFHVTLGLLLAVALNGPIRGRAIYRLLLIIPWAVPAYITALTWRGMFNYEYGAVNLLLLQLPQMEPLNWIWQTLGLAPFSPDTWYGRWFDFALHLRPLGWLPWLYDSIGVAPPINWLGDVWNAFTACVVTNVWLGFPFMMVIALGGMQGIPQELYEAARIDRASRWQQFWHITLPMLKPVLIPAVTLGTIWTFNNLNVVWLVSNTGEPQDKTHILVSYVYKSVFNLYRYGYGAALSMLIFCLLLAFSLLFLNRTRATENVYG